jgi:hypothetical protein
MTPTITVHDGNGNHPTVLTKARYDDLVKSGMMWEFHPDAPTHWPHDSDTPMTNPNDPLPDSGQRAQFSTGAVRDASIGKGHFDSIPPVALRKLAKRFEDGSRKYKRANWMKGIPLSHYENSLTRHILAWKEGDESEDHAGAIIWNSCCMVWTDEEIKAGRLPKELDDLLYRRRT